MIFAFGFQKKYDLSLLLIEGRVLDRCRAFDRLASVDAHLCDLQGPVLRAADPHQAHGQEDAHLLPCQHQHHRQPFSSHLSIFIIKRYL